MRKLILVVLVSGIFSSLFASKYICYRYVNGEATGGFVKVYADSKSEAEKKSLKKYLIHIFLQNWKNKEQA